MGVGEEIAAGSWEFSDGYGWFKLLARFLCESMRNNLEKNGHPLWTDRGPLRSVLAQFLVGN